MNGIHLDEIPVPGQFHMNPGHVRPIPGRSQRRLAALYPLIVVSSSVAKLTALASR